MPNDQELDSKNINSQEAGAPGVFQQDEPGVYGVLKCYFYTPKRGDIWGAFCFLFNGITGESMDNVFWVTRELNGPAIDVNSHWKTLNKTIPQMGNYERSLGEKLSVLMVETFSVGARLGLCQNTNTAERVSEISAEIRNNFERSTHCFLEVRMAFELIAKQDLVSSGVLGSGGAQAAAEADSPQTEEKSFAGTLINCLPVIDPVHGKPVSELKPDDILEVKLQGGIGASELIYKFLESTNQEAVFPVDRVEKDSNSEKTYIFLKINEEVQGIITVTKDLRLRVLNVHSRKLPSISLNVDNIIFFGILAAAVMVIAFVLNSLIFNR